MLKEKVQKYVFLLRRIRELKYIVLMLLCVIYCLRLQESFYYVLNRS